MGKLNNQFTWLHVTDFHIKGGDSYDTDRVLNALVEEVRRLCDNGKAAPDVIFATGDIAHGGKENQYELATAFFDALLDATGLDKTRLYVISGNHDVDRVYGDDLKRTLESTADADRYFKPGTPKPHFAKFNAFRAWYDNYFDGVRQLAGDTTCEPLQMFEVHGLQVAVASINSALFCQGDDDHNKLWVGRRCLEPVAAAAKSSKAHVRIALIHHPPDWLYDDESDTIQALLGDHFDIILRGHLHKVVAETIVGSLGNELRIASGAAYQGSRWPNLCLYGTADYAASVVRLYPIEYTDEPRPRWQLATRIFPDQPDYVGVLNVKWKSAPPPDSDEGGGSLPSGPTKGGTPPTTASVIAESLISRAQEPLTDHRLGVIASFIDPVLNAISDIRDIRDRLDSLEREGKRDANVFGRLTADAPVLPPTGADPQRSSQWVRVTALVDTAHDFLTKGKPSAARDILVALLTDKEDPLPPDLEYRVYANLGVAAWEQEDFLAAERHIEQARVIQPENPKAIANAALIALLQDHHEEAIRLAKEAMTRDVKVDNGASTYIQACSALRRIDEVQTFEKSQPWVLSDPFCALGLSEVYFNLQRFDEAARFARTAIGADIGPHSRPAAHFLLAQALTAPVSDRIENDPPLRWRIGDESRVRLEEANAELTSAIELSSAHENKRLHVSALGVRAGVNEMLGRYADVLTDCNEVIRLCGADGHFPESLDTALINKATVLLKEERSQEALSCFEAVKGDSFREKFSGTQAAAYLELDQPQKAINLLEPFWSAVSAGDRTNLDKVRLLIGAHRKAGDTDKAREMVGVLENVYADDPDVLVMRAEMRLLDGATDDGLALLRQAEIYLKEIPRDQTTLRLAQLLSHLELYTEAAEQFAKLVDEDEVVKVNPFFLGLYVVCLYNAGAFKKALNLASKVREAHGIVPQVAEVEARVLDSIGDRTAALELRRTLVIAEPDRAAYHRLSCVFLLFQMGEEETARKELLTIELAVIGNAPDSLMNAAQLRSLLGIDGSLLFAYKARRLAFSSPEIHMAYIKLVLGRDDDDSGLNPDTTAAGCSIKLERDGTLVTYIIEDIEPPDRERFELAPTDALAKRLTGLRVGDKAIIKERLGRDVSYSVKEVLSKYVYAFQQSMMNFETWFPDSNGIEQLQVSADNDSELKLRLDERERRVSAIMKLYQTRQIPMTSFAHMVGRPLFTIWWETTQPGAGLNVFCATGQRGEYAELRPLSESARCVVLDPVAIMTLTRLGLGEALAARFDKLLVAQTLVDAFREWHREVSEERPHTVMGRQPGGGYFLTEVNAEDIAHRRDFLSRVLAFLQSSVEVRSVAGLLDLEVSEQEKVGSIIGRPALASIILARDLNVPFYSDDMPLRSIASGEWKVIGIDSQYLLSELFDKKIITGRQYLDCVDVLIEANYDHVYVNADFLFSLFIRGENKLTPSLERAFQRLSSAHCDEDSAVNVATGFIFHLWSRTVRSETRLPVFECVISILKLRGNHFLSKLRAAIEKTFQQKGLLTYLFLPNLLFDFDRITYSGSQTVPRTERVVMPKNVQRGRKKSQLRNQR